MSRLRRARVLLRIAHRGLRARLHRQHRRHDVRVRRPQRQAALGAPARLVHLRRGGGLGRRVFVGTYDGKFYALDAATGDTIWQIEAPGGGARGPDRGRGPRVLRHLLELRLGGPARRQAGPDGTYAVRASNGRRVWSFRDGKYANPVVADADRALRHGPRAGSTRSGRATAMQNSDSRARQRPQQVVVVERAADEHEPEDRDREPRGTDPELVARRCASSSQTVSGTQVSSASSVNG